jgi:hypothetical protein
VAAIVAANLPSQVGRSVRISISPTALKHSQDPKADETQTILQGRLAINLDIFSVFRPESSKQAQREREEEERENAKVSWTAFSGRKSYSERV